MVATIAPVNEGIPDIYVTNHGVHRFTPTLSQEARRWILEQNAEMDRVEAAWIAKGRPWSDDDETLLERMSGY